mgnify:CR=1 FL=1
MNTAKERYRKRPIAVRDSCRDLGSPFPSGPPGWVDEVCSDSIPFSGRIEEPLRTVFSRLGFNKPQGFQIKYYNMNTTKERYRERLIPVRGSSRDLGSPFPSDPPGWVDETCSESIPFSIWLTNHSVLSFPIRTSTNLNYFD